MTTKVKTVKTTKKTPNLKAVASDDRVPKQALYWLGPNTIIQWYYDGYGTPMRWGVPLANTEQEFADYAERFFNMVYSEKVRLSSV